MGTVKKIEPNDKAMKKIRLCREAGMDIRQDFLQGVAEVRRNDEVVLRCVRVTDETWQMEYNERFWEAKERETDQKEDPA